MVDKAIDLSIESLRARDLATARRIILDDRLINQQRFDVEQSAILLIATQQPMASDLRFLAGVLHIATDLERIGDHARSVARLTVKLAQATAPSGEPLVEATGPVPEVPALVALVRTRLRHALDAFLDRDPDLAGRVAGEDAEVDRLQDAAYARLMTDVRQGPRAPGGPGAAAAEAATYLLWVVHNLERSGDHVTNICERVIYAATARLVDLGEVDEPAPPAA